MRLLKSKKGVFEQLSNFAVMAGVFALIVVVVLIILGKLGEQAVTDAGADYTGTGGVGNCSSYACNATRTAQSEMGQFPDWLGILIIAGIGIIIIGMLKGFGKGRV